jgi:hypothetical protein
MRFRLYPLLRSNVATNVFTASGFSRLVCFFRTYRHLLMLLIVSFAFPNFLSSHRTLIILPLGSVFGSVGLVCWA